MTWEKFWELNVGREWSRSLPFTQFNKLVEEVDALSDKITMYPAKADIFKAFRLTQPSNLKVVILGQDPYPTPKKATGLSFANFNEDLGAASPSLKVIWNCIEKEFHNGLVLDFDFSLESWAKQGVMMLNTALTVEAGKAGSHIKIWDNFTRTVIKHINETYPDTIFILWGKYAEAYEPLCNIVLKYVHPAYSLYSHTNWNCPNFKEANKILLEQNKQVISW
jgi:uracil-DNA glycosylase